MPLSPMQIMLENQRDEKSMRALSDGLRNRKDVGELISLVGTKNQRGFGGNLREDVRAQQGLKEKQDQRQMTLDQYGEANKYRGSVLTETMRHNKAMEEAALLRAQQYGVMTTKDLSQNVRRLSAQLDKGGTPALQTAINNVNEELELQRKKQGGQLGAIEGQGGGAWKPQWMLGEDGKRLRNKIASVRNVLLKARSGGAVTPQEQERLYEELGFVLGNKDADFMTAWGDLNQQFNAGLNNIYAGYGDEVIQQYEMNMGRQTGPSQEDPAGDWTPTPEGTNPETGNVVVDWGG